MVINFGFHFTFATFQWVNITSNPEVLLWTNCTVKTHIVQASQNQKELFFSYPFCSIMRASEAFPKFYKYILKMMIYLDHVPSKINVKVNILFWIISTQRIKIPNAKSIIFTYCLKSIYSFKSLFVLYTMS